jgi:DNA-directed RNA polymerase subunit RPC12/RpoP
MKPIGLKPSVKNRRARWFAYLCLAVMMGTAGFFIAREGVKDGNSSFIAIGVALPFIFVIGEMIRFSMYCGSIPSVWCIDCRHTFDIKQLCKTGRCPECRSRRVVGARPDDDDPVLSLYE